MGAPYIYDISHLRVKISVKELKWEDVEKFDRHQVADNFRTVIKMVRKFMLFKTTEISKHLRKT